MRSDTVELLESDRLTNLGHTDVDRDEKTRSGDSGRSKLETALVFQTCEAELM